MIKTITNFETVLEMVTYNSTVTKGPSQQKS